MVNEALQARIEGGKQRTPVHQQTTNVIDVNNVWQCLPYFRNVDN